ncbi:MAG: enoyl-CoA hydratase/isomerase family protein [Deltaproteobacteria bacterium]|nr:enoyl-CoA hydratase/isomerase family protein [Deltaproteobacteria bacterium]MBW2255627.1 enoyl-CoA hydratase/isomerase family protein [Deltaproteobacteria bacterium]
MTTPIRTETLREGQVERIVLDRPKANVLDAEMLGAVRAHVRTLSSRSALKLVVFEGAGPHFSFGASVQEHLPAQVGDMLASFHALFRELEDLGVPTASIVRGQCLGGGFELAIACGQVFCDPSARFAVPEVTLGVFPPIAALLLPWRVRGAAATRLVITGEVVEGDQAVVLGIADVCDPDPEGALWGWFDDALAPKSAVGIRFAWRAVRQPVARALAEDLPVLERMYLDDLMSHRDPVEGLNAFLERRKPRWDHR